jgi:hypothetical protein
MNNTNNFKEEGGVPLNQAYQFQTFSPYIQQYGFQSSYSPKCTFCSSMDTIPLINDGGSFRQCNRCKKQFKAIIIRR